MKYLFIAVSLCFCIFAFYTPNVRSQTNRMGNTTGELECEAYNNTNCSSCLSNLLCYWCQDTAVCSTIDFEGFVSTTCKVEDLFVTQCVLHGLYSIIVIVAVVLLIIGVLLCLCVTCCICCCWCIAKKRNHSEDKQQLQMEQIRDSQEQKHKDREQRRAEIRNKYL